MTPGESERIRGGACLVPRGPSYCDHESLTYVPSFEHGLKSSGTSHQRGVNPACLTQCITRQNFKAAQSLEAQTEAMQAMEAELPTSGLQAGCHAPCIRSTKATSSYDWEVLVEEHWAIMEGSQPAWIASSGIQAGAVFPTQENGMCPRLFTESGFHSSTLAASGCYELGGGMWPQAHTEGGFDSSAWQPSGHRLLEGAECPPFCMEGGFDAGTFQTPVRGESGEAVGDAPWTLPEAASGQDAGPQGQSRPEKAATGPSTTLMVRNLAQRMSRSAFMGALDAAGFAGLYDFVHLPGSFGTSKNKGYGFINFVDEPAAIAFARSLASDGGVEAPGAVLRRTGWSVSPAETQGLEANVAVACSRRMRRVRSSQHRPLFLTPHGTSVMCERALEIAHGRHPLR